MGGGAQSRDTAQRQARGVGRRYEMRRLAGGGCGCGLRPGGRRFVPVEEVGSVCKIEGLQGQMLLIGGR